MNLDDFADYAVSTNKEDKLFIRHKNCSEMWVDKVELPEPLMETNVKYLMILATEHWFKEHKETNGISTSDQS